MDQKRTFVVLKDRDLRYSKGSHVTKIIFSNILLQKVIGVYVVRFKGYLVENFKQKF